MIDIQTAIKLSLEHTERTHSTVARRLSDSLSYVLAKDIYSPINMPPFRQSAMDGYALNLGKGSSYKVIGEIQAGDHQKPILKIGEAIRIFTGAPVPDTANAVVMQEKVKLIGASIEVEGGVSNGANIRPLGEQIEKGQLALAKGSLISDSTIGYLASLGITELEVFEKPKIGIIVTGNELVESGNSLSYGQIYESNYQMLKASLESKDIAQVNYYKVVDTLDATIAAIEKSMVENDLSIISGGISVGDYDFVAKALEKCGVDKIFHKVKQKPGKPLFFGKRANHLVFGLPGNPAAALTCFYVYVWPVIKKWQGRTDLSTNWIKYKCLNSFKRKAGRPQFLKALIKDGGVEILEGQNSSMLHTFAVANALCFVDENITTINRGDQLDCYQII